jgi:hypothetical protein
MEWYWQGKTEVGMQNWWNGTDRGKMNYAGGKGLSKCRFFPTTKSHMYWPGIEPKLPGWLITWPFVLLPQLAYLTSIHTTTPVQLPNVCLVIVSHSHDPYTWPTQPTTYRSTVCLTTVNKSWKLNIRHSFAFSHMYRQVADDCTSALFPRCGKYEIFVNCNWVATRWQ